MATYVYDAVNDKLNLVAGATLYADVGVGFIGAFDAEEVPDGWLIFNGQTVLRSDYPDLWARANRNNQVGVGKFYGIGDGATTFTLADLRETSLKGYGETSRSVGAHVKSGGLAVGEFIDDQLQSHTHGINFESSNPGSKYGINWVPDVAENYDLTVLATNTGREGLTTEVKAVGVVWAVKAKQTGLPIDLAQQVDTKIKARIKTKTVTGGATDENGNLRLELASDVVVLNVVPLSGSYDGLYSPFISSVTRVWYVHVSNYNTGAMVVNARVNILVRYEEI